MHILAKKEDQKISNLTFYLRKLEKEKQIKYKVSIRKEIVRYREDTNGSENRESREKKKSVKPKAVSQ